MVLPLPLSLFSAAPQNNSHSSTLFNATHGSSHVYAFNHIILVALPLYSKSQLFQSVCLWASWLLHSFIPNSSLKAGKDLGLFMKASWHHHLADECQLCPSAATELKPHNESYHTVTIHFLLLVCLLTIVACYFLIPKGVYVIISTSLWYQKLWYLHAQIGIADQHRQVWGHLPVKS